MKNIVRGNDFTLRIPVRKMVDGESFAFPLPGCEEVTVNVVNSYRRVSLTYSIDVKEDNVLLARVEGDQLACGVYALEVKGKLFGNDWRSNEYEQFGIVDNNAAGDTVFEPQEGEDSVEMDTAMVVLAPDVELTGLINGANEAIKKAEQTEADIVKSEAVRTEAEGKRKESEGKRKESEILRERSETERVRQETARQEAETERQTASEKAIADMTEAKESAVSDMTTAKETAVSDMEAAKNKAVAECEQAVRDAHVSIAYDPDDGSIVIKTGKEE